MNAWVHFAKSSALSIAARPITGIMMFSSNCPPGRAGKGEAMVVADDAGADCIIDSHITG